MEASHCYPSSISVGVQHIGGGKLLWVHVGISLILNGSLEIMQQEYFRHPTITSLSDILCYVETKRAHEYLRWSPEIQQWLCITCGRTSDHGDLKDARMEIELHACELPFVNIAPRFDNAEDSNL